MSDGVTGLLFGEKKSLVCKLEFERCGSDGGWRMDGSKLNTVSNNVEKSGTLG